MKKLLFLFLVIAPLFTYAQQPKMFIKIFGGINTNTFVYRIENVDADVLLGWQAGAGFRVSHRRGFLEGKITYVNFGVTISPGEDDELEIDEPVDIRLHALDIPIYLGYIPVKTPVFKWYLYGGLVSRFSLRGRYTYKGETNSYSPSELNLKTYNLGARFGTQVDVAMFNFDFNYTIGITNALKGDSRTNYHAFQLSLGYLF